MRCPPVEEPKGGPAANEAHKIRQENVARIELMTNDIALHEIEIHKCITSQ